MLNLDARWEIRFNGQPNGAIEAIIQIQTVSSDETILQNCTHNCSLSNELCEIACSNSSHSCSVQKQSPFCQVLDLSCNQKSNDNSTVTTTLITTFETTEHGDTEDQATPTTTTENTEGKDTGGRTTITTPTTNTDGVCVLSDRTLSAVTAILLVLLLAVTSSWLGTFIWQQRTIKNLRKL